MITSSILTLLAQIITYSLQFVTGSSKDAPNSVIGGKIKLFSQKAKGKSLVDIFMGLIF